MLCIAVSVAWAGLLSLLYGAADRKMITSLRLTLLFSVATQMHASLFLSRLRYCIQRGVYPRLLSFQKLEFLGPFLMHWTDNTWPYFIIWWLGSFLQKDWLHLLEFQTLYPMLRLGAKHPCHPNLLENLGILEFFKSLNGHMYTSKKRVNSTSTIEPAAPHHHRI